MTSFDFSILPGVNALLNGFAAILLAGGYLCIRMGRRDWHARFMIAAFIVSTVFLISYVTYHVASLQIHTPFRGEGPIRFFYYYVLLIPHIILAVAIVPMALLLVWWASRGDFVRHRRLARWAWPIWMYVSVTGVIVYLMLYRGLGTGL